jgi:hypothetical protein
MLPLLLLGCMATIRVDTDMASADVYVTRNFVPSSKEPPGVYIAHDRGELVVRTAYWSWDEFYVWAGAPHAEAKVVPVPNTVKVGPVIGVILCGLWPAIWAWGPDESQVIRVKVEPQEES